LLLFITDPSKGIVKGRELKLLRVVQLMKRKKKTRKKRKLMGTIKKKMLKKRLKNRRKVKILELNQVESKERPLLKK